MQDIIHSGGYPHKKEYARKLRVVIELENAFPIEVSELRLDSEKGDGATVKLSADWVSKAYIEEVTDAEAG